MEDSLNKVAWPVATERLTLRRLESEDLEATWRYRQLPEVTRWITSAPGTLEEYRVYFHEEGRVERDVAVEVIEADGSKALIGTVMLKVPPQRAAPQRRVDGRRGLRDAGRRVGRTGHRLG